MGHVHIRILDPVLGADSQFHPEVPEFPYTHQSYIHEPLTLMGYLDAITNKVQLVTGILILPQRQTTLAYKQGAEVDVLSGGRRRLGIGISWNSGTAPRGEPGQAQRGADCPDPDAVDSRCCGLYRPVASGYLRRGKPALPVQRPIPIRFGAGRGSNPIPPD